MRFQDIGFPCAVQVIGIVLREDEVSGHLAGVLGSVEGFVPPVDSREAETPAWGRVRAAVFRECYHTWQSATPVCVGTASSHLWLSGLKRNLYKYNIYGLLSLLLLSVFIITPNIIIITCYYSQYVIEFIVIAIKLHPSKLLKKIHHQLFTVTPFQQIFAELRSTTITQQWTTNNHKDTGARPRRDPDEERTATGSWDPGASEGSGGT